MKLKNKYFILRHGQTIYQTRKKNLTYPPLSQKGPIIKLTKEGERQIRRAAQKLKKEKIDLIFASDVYRIRQTVKIINKELHSRVNFTKRLRDVNLGIYRNRRKTDLYRDFPDVRTRFNKPPKKGESWNDCQKRIVKLLKEIDRRYKGKTILIVSHGDPLWLLEGAVKNWSADKLLRIKSTRGIIKTGEIKRL
jgi:broad specificity phosphatase PhoE